MPKDSIIAELHQNKDAYAAGFNYDLEAMARDFRQKQKARGVEPVSLPPNPPNPLDLEKSERGIG